LIAVGRITTAELRPQSPDDHLVIVAPAAPAGGWDQTARVLQQVLERNRLVGIVEVQNVPGAAGTIGLSQFVSSGPGHTRSLLVTGLVMLGATLWNDSPVSISQVTPIARLTGEYEVVAVPAASPIGDMRALVEALRRRPEAFAWGGGSAGGTDHILAGLIAEAAGVDPRRVNYVAFSGGGEAVAALLGGHVAAGVSGYGEFAAHLESGRLRAVAISSPSRVPGVAVPTLRESGLDVELVNWRGLLAAAGIPDDDRARLTGLVRRATQTADWRRILAEREWTDLYLDGAGFDAYLASERTRFARVVARLRGPAHGAPTAAGQRIVPFTVLAGGVVVLVMLLVRAGGRRRGDPGRVNRRAVSGVGVGLLVFLCLLRPLGFVIAATALFVVTARAFDSRSSADPSSRWRRRAGEVSGGAVFVVLVYVAFTRGLDLPLPESALLAWMR
jgi:putative tricarboxylic transport membrane protein